MVWVSAIILILLFVYLNRFLCVPFKFFFALIVTGAIIWSAYLLYQIQRRDPTDFDKLRLDSPRLNSSPSSINTSSYGLSPGLNNSSDCVGSECCDTGLIYDKINKICVIDTSQSDSSQGFTTIEQAYSNGEYDQSSLQEGFTVEKMLDYYPPMSIGQLFNMPLFNYACEGDTYCTYRDRTV
jgi:hypothetical protein